MAQVRHLFVAEMFYSVTYLGIALVLISSYSALHINSPFARFIKLDVALAWLNIKFSSMAHLKQLSANFHLTIQKFQKSQGY